ncbi:MAG: thioesterase family protein [Oligoflexia bacterium]|nr:thioesterase family protein [Oligoflexia bacterium]
MARVKVELPQSFHFSTEVDVQIGLINYGGHLGNDSVLTVAHEARIRFLKSLGYSELDVEGVGIILADAAIQYRAEAFRGDVLRVEIQVGEFSRVGCELLYRLTRMESGQEVARIKTGVVFFDYQARTTAPVPPAFRSRFAAR